MIHNDNFQKLSRTVINKCYINKLYFWEVFYLDHSMDLGVQKDIKFGVDHDINLFVTLISTSLK